MAVDKSAEKLRHAAEREARPAPSKKHRGKADTEAAGAHGNLTRPELSKARPPAGEEKPGKRRPSNAGTDGP